MAKIGLSVEPHEVATSNEFSIPTDVQFVHHVHPDTGQPVMASASAAVVSAMQQVGAVPPRLTPAPPGEHPCPVSDCGWLREDCGPDVLVLTVVCYFTVWF